MAATAGPRRRVSAAAAAHGPHLSHGPTNTFVTYRGREQLDPLAPIRRRFGANGQVSVRCVWGGFGGETTSGLVGAVVWRRGTARRRATIRPDRVSHRRRAEPASPRTMASRYAPRSATTLR